MVQVWTGLTRTSLIIGSIGTIQQSYPVVISSPGSGPDPKPHPQSVGVHSAVNGPLMVKWRGLQTSNTPRKLAYLHHHEPLPPRPDR